MRSQPTNPNIKRHKAAIKRSEYSRPVKCLWRDRLITAERTFFDYGCGHGDDHPARSKFERLSRQETKRGLIDSASDILTQRQWQERLNMYGCSLRGHRLVNQKDTVPKSEASASLPKRSRVYGVGKEIGGNVYVHRDYASVLGDGIAEAFELIPMDFDFTVVKLNLATKAVTFISSPNFDSADEPIVGRFILVRPDGTTLDRKQLDDPYIYHHKWLMVANDYTRFDVEQSKRRSLEWLCLSDVDKSRIGRRSYWEENVTPRLGASDKAG